MGRSEPQRTCAGCRARAPKRELLRLVRSPDGVRPDPSGSAPGRGTYLHRSKECVEEALRRGTLARALRTGIGKDEAGRLRGFIVGELSDR